MSNLFINSTGEVEQGAEWTFDVTQGSQTTRTFRGTQAYIEAAESSYIAAGWNTRVKEGAVWELVATAPMDSRQGDPGSEVPVDTWELGSNMVEKDILESNTDVVNGLVKEDLAFLREVVDGKKTTDDYDLEDGLPHVFLSPDAVPLFKLIVSGVKSKVVYQPVLRNIKTASQYYEIPNSLLNVGSVYSTARIISDESPPSDIAANLLTGGTITRAAVGVLFGGWFKTHPQIIDSAGSKVQIVQEWQYGEWAPLLYDMVT